MFDQEAIKTVLPHRDPFLFCDRILECTPQRTVAEVDYGPDRYFFKGHFPSYPVCPGVILVESMAQCGGAGYRLATPEDDVKKLFLFAKLMEVRFVNQVRPGQTVRYEIETIKKYAFQVNDFLRAFWKACGVTLVDFKLEFGRLSDGTIVLADEISPDTCRLWDSKTGEKLDKDRFRRDLGGVEEAYAEIMNRLETHL